MKLVWRGRRAGKTYDAIKNAAETGSYILVPNRQQAIHVAGQAQEMGLNIRYPVTLQELQDARMSTGFVKNLTIDNLDEILHSLFPHHKIEMVTLTAEGPPAPDATGEK